MKAKGIEIFLAPGSRTGLSALGGEALAGADGLPDYRVEIHVFRGADMAAAFVAGLEAAGLGNAMAYDWEPETTDSNRTVVLAKFDEPRADEGLAVVSHGATGHDTAAYRKSMDRIMADRASAYAVQDTEAAHVRNLLGPLHAEAVSKGPGWYRCLVDGGCAVFLGWKDKDGPFRIELECSKLYEGNYDVKDLVGRMAGEAGFGVDHYDHCLNAEDVSAGEVVASIRAMAGIVAAALEEKARLVHERFMANMRMTASRRKFLEAGQRDGIGLFVRRANRRAFAGGIEIGASEINELVRAGWIESGDRGYRVTDKGAAALAAPKHGRERTRSENDMARGPSRG